MSRSGRNGFDIRLKRRREVEKLALHHGVADTDDFPTFLVIWMQVRPETVKDPIFTVQNAARRMGGAVTEEQAAEIVEEARSTARPRTPDSYARRLDVTYALREQLGLTTIGAIDVGSAQRMVLRREKRRRREEARRRARGAKPRANSLSRTQPWKAAGMSRPTWYRRKKQAAAAFPR